MHNIPDEQVETRALAIQGALSSAQIHEFMEYNRKDLNQMSIPFAEALEGLITTASMWLARRELELKKPTPTRELGKRLCDAVDALEAGGWDQVGKNRG